MTKKKLENVGEDKKGVVSVVTLPNNFYIEIDTLGNHTLYETPKEKKTPIFYGYYGSVSGAVLSYIKYHTAEIGGTVTLKEYVERYEKVAQEVKDLIKI